MRVFVKGGSVCVCVRKAAACVCEKGGSVCVCERRHKRAERQEFRIS